MNGRLRKHGINDAEVVTILKRKPVPIPGYEGANSLSATQPDLK